MKPIVISNPTNISNEHSLLNSLFDEGLEYFHLRKPGFTSQEMEAYLLKISPIHFSKIILHSHHELVDKYLLKGKHKTAANLNAGSNNTYISTSFHTLEEMKNCDKNYEYVFLSPVFESISKQGYKSNFSSEELNNYFSSLTKNSTFFHQEVIALGGINQHNALKALKMGFEGIAVLGSIWLSDKPVQTFREIYSIYKQYQVQHV